MRKWQRGRKDYTSSYEILQYGDAQIELITEDEFGDTQQLREMEKYWVGNSNAVNQNRPVRTREEHLEDTRRRDQTEKRRSQRRRAIRNWMLKNKERWNEYQRVYHGEQIPCPTCGKVMRRDMLGKHKKSTHYFNLNLTLYRLFKSRILDSTVG